ncbi:uncharacterized protein LOC111133767 [Crassostrea virginica]|uniref:Uncharacterized protein LOC111133767 n=1 Tax=Crassostrea virginica TaxID=6565 RepID=A0A8B8EEV0_CRAVI|nr:uncharacterized protein LOC111133767 [Crassostrea virginica]
MAVGLYAFLFILLSCCPLLHAWLNSVDLTLRDSGPWGIHTNDPRHGGIRMGVPDDLCDNGKNYLHVDWNLKDPSLYSCTSRLVVPIAPATKSRPYCTDTEDMPKHVCMNETISYQETIPLSGPHRPLWPVYGEYLYLPPQRWVHSLEHGAVVMLYHPCARKEDVDKLKAIVEGCLRRHVITPYNKLPLSEPFALVTHKCRLTMNHIDQNAAVRFILKHALDAPEKAVYRDGDYAFGLLKTSRTLAGSDERDAVLCPQVHLYQNAR